jgi:hypothetical protein
VVFNPVVTADEKGVWTASISHPISQLPTPCGRKIENFQFFTGQMNSAFSSPSFDLLLKEKKMTIFYSPLFSFKRKERRRGQF